MKHLVDSFCLVFTVGCLCRHFVANFRNPNKMSIVSGNTVFYYMTRDNLCFLTLTEESYPRRVAFLYLEEVADAILQELVNEFGTGVGVVVVVPPLGQSQCCVVRF